MTALTLADLQTEIEAAWEARDGVSTATTGLVRTAVEEALLLLDSFLSEEKKLSHQTE